MSWYGIDYSSRPVYKFGAYSRAFPKSPGNKMYRDFIARELQQARRHDRDLYANRRQSSTQKRLSIPEHFDLMSAANSDRAVARGKVAALVGAGAIGARALYNRYKAKKAARLAAQQELG